MKIDYTLIGKRIQNRRKEMGMSQLVFAEKIDRSTTFVSYIENGTRSMTLDTLIQVANILDVGADYLLADYIGVLDSQADQEVILLLDDCLEIEREFIVSCLKALKKTLREEDIKDFVTAVTEFFCVLGRGTQKEVKRGKKK